MQIHRLLVSRNTLARIDDGAILEFERDVSMLDEGDALVARLDNGEERLLIVEKAYPDSWLVEHSFGSFTTYIRLVGIDGQRLRIAFEPQHKLMQEAF